MPHRGVYALHPPPYSREQLWLAAVLACRPDSILSDWPSAAHLGIYDGPVFGPHVTVAGGRGRSRPGITVHDRGPIDPRDLRVVRSIPTASAALTIVQLAPHHSAIELEVMAVAAESKRILNRGRLAELVAERIGRPGIHKLLPLLKLAPRMSKSDLELLFIPVVEAAGLPRPLLNSPIEVPGRALPLTVDIHWPDIRFVVECDSQRFHGDWQSAEDDRERDQLLALVDHSCQRFVRRVVKRDPAGAARRLAALYEHRRREVRDCRSR